MTVVLDETGLHAVECECMRCSAGFRPSPMQRHYAAEQLRRKKAWEEQQAKPSKEELRRAERRRVAAEEAERKHEEERRWRKEHPPLSSKQIEELETVKREKYPSLAGGSKR